MTNPTSNTTLLGESFVGRRVLVTGHTGFKGAWLTTWLLELGSEVIGFALEPPSSPSMFDVLRLGERLVSVHGDVRDLGAVDAVVANHQPEFVFHLAAQPLVRRSYDAPRMTFEANVMGTVNVLDVAYGHPCVRAVVCATSDKCYRNREWEWGYREDDPLGGKDPYSASKAAAECVIAAFQSDPFADHHRGNGQQPPEIASVRAGNVIGGGDWASARLVPDTMRALGLGGSLLIRQPDAIRPWQHVLEPLSGYLQLAACLTRETARYRRAYNFGPTTVVDAVPVRALVERLFVLWGEDSCRVEVDEDQSGKEATVLYLDCSRAWADLGWRSVWDLNRALEETVRWYQAFYTVPNADLYDLTVSQVRSYVQDACELGLPWTH